MKTDEFLALARKRFSAAAEDEKGLREKFVHDLKFASPDGDEQWDPQVKQQREAAGRPAMSFPRCHVFVAQVSNQGRQNKPQIKFAPRLDADKDTAEVMEGLARFIQYDSDAQVAYETALRHAAGASFGYFRFLTQYCDYDSDEQELVIKPVQDPLQVYGIIVPHIFGRKPAFAFVIEDVPKEEYKAQYPDSEASSLDWAEVEKRWDGWAGSETIRIAEYWVREEIKGSKGKPKYKVKFYKTNGFEILDETDWPGSTIPIIPVLGEQDIIDGKPRLYSVVRPQKAAQQLINYSKSRIAETLSTSPVSPFLVATGQIPSGKESQWANLNKTLTPFLEYSPIDVNGRPVPPPQRQTFEPPIQSLSAFVAQEIDDMKATTGIFDASLGNQSNETSGQAIARRQQQADIATMHYMDNLLRAFKQGGEVIMEVVPEIYDTAREIQILGEDEAPKVIQANQEFKDPKTGKVKKHDLTKGKYHLVVTMVKAYGSKRAETFDTMGQIIQTNPQMFPIVGDIMLRNSDMAGAEQAADRLHKMLPPPLQDNNSPLPPEAQAVVAQAHQQMGLMQQELQKAQFDLKAKTVEHQGKLQQIQMQSQADMALEEKKLQAQLAVAEINTKAQRLDERLAFVEEFAKQLHSQAHDAAMQQQDHANALQQQQAAAQQQQAMAQQQAQNQSAQSAQDAAQSQAAQQTQEG